MDPKVAARLANMKKREEAMAAKHNKQSPAKQQPAPAPSPKATPAPKALAKAKSTGASTPQPKAPAAKVPAASAPPPPQPQPQAPPAAQAPVSVPPPKPTRRAGPIAPIFTDMVFVLDNGLESNASDITDRGGQIVYSVTNKVDVVISRPEEFASRSAKVDAALRSNIPVVALEWLDESITLGLAVDQASFLLNKVSGPSAQDRRRNPAITLKSRAPVKKREVRVFLSSTFKDMGEERAALSKNVFPELESFCAERNVQFTTIDLRWGITAQESAGGKVISLCLSEIDMCRPYFVSFLGERYGWARHTGADDRLLAKTFAMAIRDHPWLEKYQDRSVTELEILYGALLHDRNVSRIYPEPARCFLYLRDPQFSLRGGPDFVETHPEAKRKLTELKNQIRESYCVTADYAVPQDLAESLLEKLKAAIDEDFPKDDLPHDDRENHAHLMFGESQLSVHLPRGVHLRQLEDFVSGNGNLAVVSGEPGLGKGHLIASWYLDHHVFDGKGMKLVHFCQAGSRGNPLSVLLHRILVEVKKHFKWNLPIPESLDELLVEFPAWLQRTGTVAGNKGKVVLCIDGIDQCDDIAAQELRWLPKILPKSVKIILTSRPGPVLDKLLQRGAKEIPLTLLNDDECDSFATDYLARFGKKLTPAQKLELLGSNAPVKNPLFLRTLLDQLRTYATFETLGPELTRYLGVANHEALFLSVFGSWEQEASKAMVADTLAFLWCARRGLTETELAALLGLTQRQQWSFLWLNLAPHLVSRGGVFRFSNPYIRTAVEQTYLQSPAGKTACAERMIRYFSSIPTCKRKVYELPHLLILAGQSHKLSAFLSDLEVFDILSGPDERPELLSHWKAAGGGSLNIAAIVEGYLGGKSSLAPSPRTNYLVHRLAAFFTDLGAFQAAKSLYLELLGTSKKLAKSETAVANLIGVAKASLALGEYSEASLEVANARRMAEQVFGRLSLEAAESIFLQGLVRKKQGKYGDAKILYEQALRTAESFFGPRHPRIATYLDSFADVLRKLDYFEKALDMYKRALDILESVLGSESMPVAEVLRNIGLVKKKEGLYDEAETDYRRAVGIVEALYGTEHLKLGIFLNDLADCYRKRGSYEEAMTLYNRSLQITTLHLGSGHPDVADISASMGLVEKKRGNYDLAEQYFLGASDKILASLGVDHPKHGVLLNNLADIARKRGQYTQAEEYYKRALAILEKSFGREHVEVAEVLNNLGILYKKLGKYTEARPLYERGMKIIGDAFGEDHFKHGQIMNNLADICRKEGDYEIALDLYKRSLANLEVSLGKGHIETADPWDGIGRIYSKTGVWKESIPAFENALSIVEAAVGREHYKYGMFLGNLGDTRRKQGDLDKASVDLEAAVGILERSLGSDHPETGDVLLYRGRLRRRLGHPGGDADLVRALDIVVNSVGTGHSKYQEVRDAMDEVVVVKASAKVPKPEARPIRGEVLNIKEVWSPWGYVPIIPPQLRTPRPSPAPSRASTPAPAMRGGRR